MANKTLGYILAVAGIVIFLLSYPGIRAMLKIPIPANISDTFMLIACVALLFIGAFMAFRRADEPPKEIPIYEGTGKERKLVGIQRISKK